MPDHRLSQKLRHARTRCADDDPLLRNSISRHCATQTTSHYAQFYRRGARRQNRTGNLPGGAPPITAGRRSVVKIGYST
jgi:hypothetical protein